MVLKELAPVMTKSFVNCECGGKAEFTLGTIRQKIGDRTILVHNVPHYRCSACGSIAYDIDIRLSPLLKHAYLNGLFEVDYSS